MTSITTHLKTWAVQVLSGSYFELAQLIARVTGFSGKISTDPTKPDGTMRKLMDVGRLAQMGWSAGIRLERGLADTYEWYLANIETVRA